MGCDIHAGIEVNDGNGWTPLKWPNRWHRDDDPEEPPQTARLDLNRNYDAFAILANVRNGYGFAGCDTGDGFVPIAEPRGLPDDAHPETIDQACTGDHSATYVTADELLSYDWTRCTKKRGWVNAVAFEAWDRRKAWDPRPSDWCGGISGRDVEHISEQEMRRKVKDVMGDKPYENRAEKDARLKTRYSNTYCLIEWEEPYTEAAGDLWTKVVPLVMKLKREHRDVRLVMNFDS
jgi:hypothetical protein